MSFRELSRTLVEIFRKGVHQPLPEDLFNELALRIFRFQCENNPAYRAFVTRRGAGPDGVRRWREIPPLPTRAFKSAVLVSGEEEDVEGVFLTSGTSQGEEARGAHHVLDLGLYRESLLPNFRAHLLPDTEEKTPVLCLLPSPERVRDSSLSFMMGEVVEALGSDGSGFFMASGGEIDSDPFRRALEDAEESGARTLLVGTAFAFVRWTESARENGWSFQMPEGSRIMETGGYKGRSRELPRAELYGLLQDLFAIPERFIINEYGMTELLSQFYEPLLVGERVEDSALDDRFHRGPPWVRTQVVDPLTLDPVPPGARGVLSHFDLANLGSVSAVLTEDLGREVTGGFQLMGRNPGSEPRGCSLAMEDFLASRRSS